MVHMIIAASPGNTAVRHNPRRKWIAPLTILCGVAITVLSFLVVGVYGWFILLAILFIVPLSLKIYSQQQKLPFIAWVEDYMLHFEYFVQDENLITTRRVFAAPLTEIRSYTVHTFLKGKPAFIEIHLDNGIHSLTSPPINIEDLPQEQIDKLINFLDSLMVKRRRVS